jgi:hypothetical protein
MSGGGGEEGKERIDRISEAEDELVKTEILIKQTKNEAGKDGKAFGCQSRR